MPAPIQVELLPYSPSWELAARSEALRLRSAWGEAVLTVHHIGSTAVPNLRAKPIVDLLPVVRSVADLDEQQALFLRLGYQYWGEYGILGRRYCTWDDAVTGQRKIQLHCFEPGSCEIERHLAFRDFLRASPQKAREYESEKSRCRELHPADSHAYSTAKSDWISVHLPAALAYFRSATTRHARG